LQWSGLQSSADVAGVVTTQAEHMSDVEILSKEGSAALSLTDSSVDDAVDPNQRIQHFKEVLDGEGLFELQVDKASKFHNMELLVDVLSRKFPPLYFELQELLDSSAGALKSDPSEKNTQRVMLGVLTQTLRLAAMRAEATDAETQSAMFEVLERSAQFVEANVAVPQFNSKEATGVRTLVFNVYDRLAKVLGRNTPEAVKADTKAKIVLVAEHIEHAPGYGRASKVTPQEHVVNVVMPLLDEDEKQFAHDMSVYHSQEKPSLMKFYRLLATRSSRSKQAVA
jgi:hypothetical protein